MDKTQITIAIIALLGPLVTGLVTAGGIALERRRNDRDLEARRLKLIQVARDQIAAVQPLWNSIDNKEATTPTETRDRAYAIVISALDSILRAQAMTQPEKDLHQRAAKVEEQNRGSVISDLLLRQHFETRGARAWRIFYYLAFAWATMWLIATFASISDWDDPEYGVGATVGLALAFVVTGLIPLIFIRKWAVGHERRNASGAHDHDESSDRLHPMSQYPFQVPPFPQGNQASHNQTPLGNQPLYEPSSSQHAPEQ